MTIQAFDFDVDGTIAETEEMHRASFNQAFAESGLGWSWAAISIAISSNWAGLR